MTTAAKIEFKASAQFNPVFRPVNEWRGRYRILKGSAGSGKSVNIAQDYIAKLSDPAYTGANLLVVRKIEETNRDSTFAGTSGRDLSNGSAHTPNASGRST